MDERQRGMSGDDGRRLAVALREVLCPSKEGSRESRWRGRVDVIHEQGGNVADGRTETTLIRSPNTEKKEQNTAQLWLTEQKGVHKLCQAPRAAIGREVKERVGGGGDMEGNGNFSGEE